MNCKTPKTGALLCAFLACAFCALVFFAAPSRAAIMYGTFTNAYGVGDTNTFLIYPIVGTTDQSGNPIANADGSFVVGGPPRRIRPNSIGYWQTNLMVGNYLASNQFLGRGIAFRAPDDLSPVSLYAVSSNLISGYNMFVTIVFGTNPAPTSVEVTNALGFLPLTPLQSTNISISIVPTNLWTPVIATLISNLIYYGHFSTNTLGAGSNITLTTNAAGQIIIASTASGGGGTNQVGAGSLVTVTTNGTTYTVNALSQTNGQTSIVFSNITTLVFSNQLIPLTNQLATTNFAKLMTNGMSPIVFSNVTAFVHSNQLPTLTNTFAVTNDSRRLDLSSTNSLYAGQLTNGINRGNAFSSPNPTSGSEQFGRGANASGGTGAMSIGTESSASAISSSAIGYQAEASGYQGTAIGPLSSASGGNAFAMGPYTTASETNTVAIGYAANAEFANSMAIGSGSVATVANEIVFGTASQFVMFPGNGTVAGVFTNGTTVLTNGFVDRDLVLQWTTNNIFVTNAGSATANGTYLYGSLGVYTNSAMTNWNMVFQNPTWFIRSNAVNHYSAANPAGTWSGVSGTPPSPVTGYGANIYLAGQNFIGFITSTNLAQRLLDLTNFATLQFQNASNYSITLLQASTNYTITLLQASTNYTILQLQAATNHTLVASNNLGVRINMANTNIYEGSASVTVTTNAGGRVVLTASGSGGSATNAIANNNGRGTNTTIIDLSVTNSDLFFVNGSRIMIGSNNVNVAARSVISGGHSNTIGNASIASVIIGGESNSIGFEIGSSYANTILGGVRNAIADDASYNLIGGRNNNIGAGIAGAQSANVALGIGNRIGIGSGEVLTESFAMGQSNTIGGINITNAWAMGRNASVAHSDTFLWSDGTTVLSGTTNIAVLIASNGVAINTNHPRGYGLHVNGSINGTALYVNGTLVVVATTNSVVQTNDSRAVNLTNPASVYAGVVTNGNISTTNMMIGGDQIVYKSTNTVSIRGAAGSQSSVRCNGTYQWSTLGFYTNLYSGHYITNIAGVNYLENSINTILYSSSNLETNAWTVVGGGATVPNSSYGEILDLAGLGTIGDLSGFTNLPMQITNIAQLRATNQSSVADGMVPVSTGSDFKLIALASAITNAYIASTNGLAASLVLTNTATNNATFQNNATISGGDILANKLDNGTAITQHVATAISDAIAAQPVVSASQNTNANTTELALTNSLGLTIALRVYSNHTNTVDLSQVSAVAPIDTNAVVRVLADRISITTGPLLTIYSGAGWAAAGLITKTLTNNGQSWAPGRGVYVSTANVANYFSNQPNGYALAKTASITWTQSVRGVLLTGLTNTWVESTGGSANAGTVWGTTNFFWLAPSGGGMGNFRSDGMTVWSNVVVIP